MNGSTLRDMRLQARLRQEDIGHALGITKATVSRFETGRLNVTLQQAREWAQTCGFVLTFLGPEHEAAVRDLATLAPADAALARRVMAILPDLHPLRRADLENLLESWARVSGSSIVRVVKSV